MVRQPTNPPWFYNALGFSIFSLVPVPGSVVAGYCSVGHVTPIGQSRDDLTARVKAFLQVPTMRASPTRVGQLACHRALASQQGIRVGETLHTFRPILIEDTQLESA